jgi:hypothetical protein
MTLLYSSAVRLTESLITALAERGARITIDARWAVAVSDGHCPPDVWVRIGNDRRYDARPQ